MYTTYAKIRDELGLTDYRVAEMTAISRSTMSDWKNGKSTPKADKLLRIACVLGVSVEDLFKEEG